MEIVSIILMRFRCTKESHYGIPDELLNESFVPGYDLSDLSKDPTHGFSEYFRVEFLQTSLRYEEDQKFTSNWGCRGSGWLDKIN